MSCTHRMRVPMSCTHRMRVPTSIFHMIRVPIGVSPTGCRRIGVAPNPCRKGFKELFLQHTVSASRDRREKAGVQTGTAGCG